jgi:hypothetical protein
MMVTGRPRWKEMRERYAQQLVQLDLGTALSGPGFYFGSCFGSLFGSSFGFYFGSFLGSSLGSFVRSLLRSAFGSALGPALGSALGSFSGLWLVDPRFLFGGAGPTVSFIIVGGGSLLAFLDFLSRWFETELLLGLAEGELFVFFKLDLNDEHNSVGCGTGVPEELR